MNKIVTNRPMKARRRSKAPNPIDVHVGSRVRLRRTMLGMTCTQLGHALGTTFQQIQKYERGINRVSASKLLDLSRVLNVPISFFFESFNADVAEAISQAAAAKSEPVARKDEPDPMMRREILVLVRAYCRISDRRTRQSIADLVIRMAREEKGFMN